MNSLRTAARVSVCAIALAGFSNAARAATIAVPAGGDLHGALTNAQPGDTIVLEPGATYVGNFTLPNKNGASYITLQTVAHGLPGAGARIAEIKAVGQDSQAIAGWNGPGPYAITNNYLEGAGENVIFGGADPTIPNLVPGDITIAGNAIAKRPAWRSENWTVKNLLELKNARRVSIHDNTVDYN